LDDLQPIGGTEETLLVKKHAFESISACCCCCCLLLLLLMAIVAVGVAVIVADFLVIATAGDAVGVAVVVIAVVVAAAGDAVGVVVVVIAIVVADDDVQSL
jgi:hypothetical protein